jgi:cell division transport system permease protein
MSGANGKSAPPVVKESVRRGWRPLGASGDTALVPQARMSGPMPWLVAIMVAITAVAAAGALALGNMAASTSASIEGGVTVQVLEPDERVRTEQIDLLLPALQDLAGIASVRRVPQEELDALVEPWLGEDAVEGGNVPIPAMIDIRLRGEPTGQDIARIEQVVAPLAPDARVDTQASWLGPVFEAVESLRWLALALIVLLAAATSAAVLLAARTAINAHRDTIEVVHMLGGTDGQIARIFQRSIALDAAGGGAIGLAVALVTIVAVGLRFAGLGDGLAGQATLEWNDWLALAAVPIVGVLLAMATARFSVMRALGKML